MPIFREPLQGVLIEHGSDHTRPLSAFLTGASGAKRLMLIVGGQLDGYFSLPFIRPLLRSLGELEASQGGPWATVVTRFGSSYIGARDSHVQDAADLNDLVNVLANKFDAQEICLFGWDTGVQVVIEYLTSFAMQAEVITRVILNGAVANPLNEVHCSVGQHRRKEYVEKAVAEGRRHERIPMPEVYDKDVTVGRMTCGGYLTIQEAVWNPACNNNTAAIRDALSSVRVPLLVQVLPGPGYDVSEKQRGDVDHFVSSNAASTEVYVDFIDNAADEKRDIMTGCEDAHVNSILKFLGSADKRRDERVEEQKSIDYESDRRQRSVLYNNELAYSARH